MSSLFLNPWTMAIGALLILAPIIIHLINRLRVKRVRWAAMEFLLKAQKKLKRKVILQQLLLLLSRCLLVGLIGLIFGRFIGCGSLGGKDTRPAVHLVFIDDSPSMGDGFRGDNGRPTDCFEEAKRVLVEQIATAVSQASSPQTFEVMRASDLANSRAFGRANSQVIEEMRNYLNGFKPVSVRTPLNTVLTKAKEMAFANATKDVSQVVHIISDFRTSDWQSDGPMARDIVKDMTSSGVKVHFVDVAHPYRKSESKALPWHDNIGIIEFRPSKPTVARGEPVEFVLRVQNFGNSELKDVQISIRVNGDENKGGRRVSIPTLPGNQDRTVKVEVLPSRVGTPERPLDRFSLVTAVMETPEPGGIAADNIRHAVIEVKEKLPFFVVEGRPALKDKREGDGFYLRTIFSNVLGGYSWENKSVRDLETTDLRKYSCVFLLNVPTLTEAASKALDTYVRDGGGVGVFLGPDVRPAEYNKTLYADGTSWFPVPLPERPTEPLPEEEQLLRRFNMQKKLMLRDRGLKTHPAVSGLYTDDRGMPTKDEEELEKYFRFVSINQYWPIRRLGKWKDDKSVTELFCMPNDQKVSNYEGAVQAIENKLPIDEPKFEKAKAVLVKYKDELRKARSGSEPLFKLATLLDRFLADTRGEGDADEAILREFWASPETADLRTEVSRLRDNTKFGDPFYIARQYGRGRVTLITSTAGEQWNDWPSAPPGNVSFGPLMKELATYLSGGAADENRSVGEPVELTFDPAKYRNTVARSFMTHDPTKEVKAGGADPAPIVDLGQQTMTDGKTKDLKLSFTETMKPGAYLFTLAQIRAQGAAPEGLDQPDYRAFAFNVDAIREGDLHRTITDDLAQYAPGAPVHSPIETEWLEGLKNKSKDLSEFATMFLIMILLLISSRHWP
ncbi:MAG: VWA domain-containing protein [Gemmataceae bacterium]